MIPSVPGLSRAEVELGLQLNIGRSEARQAIGMATGIGLAFGAEGSDKIKRLAGVPESEIQRHKVDEFHQQMVARLRKG